MSTQDTAGRSGTLDGGPLAGDLSFLLARANALAAAATNAALAELELRVRPYAVLALAASGTRMTQREIAEYLRLDPSQVVALVDGLQRRDLVAREPDPRDRRTNVVAITPAGAELHARAALLVAQAERTAHGDLTATERESLADLLRRAAFP